MDVDVLLGSVPTPSADEMLRRRGLAQKFTLVFLRLGPASHDDDERNERLQDEHQQHLTKLQLLGKLMWNGPVLVEHDIRGVSVYKVGLEEARALAEADPKNAAHRTPLVLIPGS